MKLKLNDRQKQIINFAKNEKSFQTKDVFEFIKKDFPVERLTVVRDLAFLEKNKVLKKQGKGRGISYKISKKYLVIEEIDVEEYYETYFKNRKIKMQFNKEIFTLLKDGIFDDEELKNLERLNKKYLKLEKSLRKESPAIFRKEWERLIIEFSWKSSEIEGNTYSLLETEALIKEMHFVKGKDKLDAQMILNHKEALDYIMENKNDFKKISAQKIEKVHNILAKGLGINLDFRNRIVTIGGTLYRPLFQREEIITAVNKMTKVINKIKNPFEQAFIALIMIAYIQPFDDGNKRTSRLIANAILHANGKAMLSYRDVDTVEYKKAVLLFYEQNNVFYFKKIFMEQFDFAVNNYFL